MHFRPLDIVTLLLYLAGMAVMGLYFARRNKTTEEYFVGGRNFPGWAIGISMLGTSISSVTFLAFPAAAFVLDWRQLMSNMTLPLVALPAVLIFIPLFRRGRTTSAFEYLGNRFGPTIRLYGTLTFIVYSLIWIAKILFLVSIPVGIMTGASIALVIIAVGLFIAFYTIAGGIDAVIWTDVVQAVVLWGGGLLCVGFIVFQVPGGFGQIMDVALEHKKFGIGSMHWDPGERTFWTVSLLGVFTWLRVYACDQTMVQRYAAARSTREARKAVIIYSTIAVPTWIFFFFVGTALFVYYQMCPDPTIQTLDADQILPYFILTKIPAGLAGLVIAGVLAASMSSLDSSINAISTLVIVDLMKPYLAKGRDDSYYLRMARWIAVGATVVMIGGAIGFHYIDKESVNDLSWTIASVLAGCLVGLFMLGFFSRRVDETSALIALVAAIGVNVYLGLGVIGVLPPSWVPDLHAYWIGIVVNLFFVTLAYVISLIRRSQPRQLEGLTIWSMPKNGG